jgi:hypothetical protein
MKLAEANQYFDAKQRQVLLGWILDIEESRRWHSRDYWHALLLKRPDQISTENDSLAIRNKKKEEDPIGRNKLQ